MLPFDIPLEYQGIKYYAPENFYQAMKLPEDRLDLREEIASLPPKKSKLSIKRYKWREDWNKDEAIKVMKTALYYKFNRCTSWSEQLLATGDEEIIEWNNWHDTFWGKDVNTKEGENHLGKILMEIRLMLKQVEQ